MSFQHKPNSGSLFKNDKKETDAHPNAKGTALIDGVEYWVSAWTNKDKNDQPYQKLTFKRKDEAHSEGMNEARKAADLYREEVEDDIPFS